MSPPRKRGPTRSASAELSQNRPIGRFCRKQRSCVATAPAFAGATMGTGVAGAMPGKARIRKPTGFPGHIRAFPGFCGRGMPGKAGAKPGNAGPRGRRLARGVVGPSGFARARSRRCVASSEPCRRDVTPPTPRNRRKCKHSSTSVNIRVNISVNIARGNVNIAGRAARRMRTAAGRAIRPRDREARRISAGSAVRSWPRAAKTTPPAAGAPRRHSRKRKKRFASSSLFVLFQDPLRTRQ